MDWLYGNGGRKYCATCKAAAKQRKVTKECSACRNRLDADPAIVPYFDCFTLCDTQLRAAFGGAYAMDWSVVMQAATAQGIALDARFFRLLKLFEAGMLGHMNKKEVSS